LESEWCGNAWDSSSQPSANYGQSTQQALGARSKRDGCESIGDQDLGCPPSFCDVRMYDAHARESKPRII